MVGGRFRVPGTGGWGQVQVEGPHSRTKPREYETGGQTCATSELIAVGLLSSSSATSPATSASASASARCTSAPNCGVPFAV